ncbi:caspase family protein [Rhizobium ruizarguesonis]|uniref:caspase family protein n=1 Tax=Rhizobium ruizarguesonis TaxID=2081791 RepID=UPI00103247FE|nr:caspase family protein [Rhizobium ruizarguesonis]TBD24988.1 peptidase C14, caspase catalytic subunit p20 [Rhizobium ruizarguesonis]TBD26050.1 peptidase C14, caspase catalytic subunit p20 [Rhizobium ruizarguesonis]TBD51268.1 peptidase C14, caspase catalytic subunit p20 [Rhizobium ruizarguesonis]TBD73991.1 peptidase C14, caspase catalytic subunit p20 [Rhizobium ruizarguesonis]TBD74103.1 peptidase C14, caspase catalytic subunit p20 [Rhizobium ruizarguesonis]
MPSNGKISLEELNKRLADPSVSDEELTRYFEVDEKRSGPFSPVFALNPQTVNIPPTAEGTERSAALLNSANFIARLRRHVAFNARVGEGSYRGPILVSEGDSWFQYPFKLTDVIDDLMQRYAVFSLDAAGDTLSNMFREAEYMEAIANTGASIFLFSGGGNDIVAGGNLAAHLSDFDPAKSPAAHLRPSFNLVLDEAIGIYSKLVRQVAQKFPNLQIICHGYDYTVPANGPWLGKPMASRNITDPALQKAIARVMVDRFNERLALLQASSARLHYIDCRNTVQQDEWYDELHPTNDGYRKVAKKFSNKIEELSQKPKAVDTRANKARAAISAETTSYRPVVHPSQAASRSAKAKGGPAGRSLHIGLNAVDPGHYAGWSGPLNACEFDAQDIYEIAGGLGYDANLLLTANATRDNVAGEIERAARDLSAGDIFFISYSGHGGQIPDFNGDEEDGVDETWCLFDRQLIDDEQYMLWSKFKPGVRVLVVSDSCHSGSVIRAVNPDSPQVAVGANPLARAMPSNIASRTFRQNRDLYNTLGSSLSSVEAQTVLRAMEMPISCSVRLISGCQDNQTSLDGLGNGAFTAALINVWDNGRFSRNYAAFHGAILRKMPETQSPNHWAIGPKNPVFDAQTPFAI